VPASGAPSHRSGPAGADLDRRIGRVDEDGCSELIDITRFDDDGLAHEHWGVFDALSMKQQLGAIPAMAPPT
jgi:hypothetical protein